MKKRVMRSGILAVLAVLLILSMNLTAFADDQVDMDRNDCALSLILDYKDTAGKTVKLDGGSLELYRIKELETKTSEELDAKNAELAASLSKDLSSRELTAKTAIKDGLASFSKLTPGIYLIYQSEPCKNGMVIPASLISIPDKTGNYQITCRPKPGIPTKEQPPKTPHKGKIPHTGQLKWPVPVLSVLGVLLVLLGVRKLRHA